MSFVTLLRFIKMKNCFFILFLCVVGCVEDGAKPEPIFPEIVVEINDTVKSTEVCIYFRNHGMNNGGVGYAKINNIEELKKYKKQVEFLLNRLDEAENKMSIHEPETELDSIP